MFDNVKDALSIAGTEFEAGFVKQRVIETQLAMMEHALHCCLVHVPVDEMVLEQNPNSNEYRLIVRGLTMYRTKCDLTAKDVDVEGEWLNWPPPEKSTKRGKFQLVD